MSVWIRAGVLIVAGGVLTAELPAQIIRRGGGPAPRPIGSIGGAIAVPKPRALSRVDMKKFEIPELAGAMPVDSALVDGQLPKPVVDYGTYLNGITERITIFQNGLVAMHMSGSGGRIQKRLMLPPDAVINYRRSLHPLLLDAIRQDDLSRATPDRKAWLRVSDDTGWRVERTFSPVTILPQNLEKQRTIMQDLLRAVAEDREISNPIILHKPAVGDWMVGDDQKLYTISQILDQGTIIELKAVREPVKMFVKTDQLFNHFFATGRSEPN